MAPGMMALRRLSLSEVGRRNLRVAWQSFFFLEKKIESVGVFHQVKLHKLGCSGFGTWELSVLWSHSHMFAASVAEMIHRAKSYRTAPTKWGFPKAFCSYLLIKDSGKWWFILSNIFYGPQRIEEFPPFPTLGASHVQHPISKSKGHGHPQRKPELLRMICH